VSDRADRPNSKTRKRYRMALDGAPCMTCGLGIDWRTVGKPDSATFGHIIADTIGGKWHPNNIGAQCWTCNKVLADRRIFDLSFRYARFHFAYDLPSQRDADEWESANDDGATERYERLRILDSL
jgi:hypothetical protein